MFLLAFALLVGRAKAATLSVSPASTSNTYGGVLTLQIGGLTNAEAVVVQEYMDLNSNSILDGNDLLVDTFPITDGGVAMIGGQTNLNVPFDSNATGGAITTTLFFSTPLAIENIVGQHIFRLVSPTGRFAPVDTVFTVTNAALNQTLTGTVYRGGVPASNAVVVALTLPSTSYAGAATTDSAGHYTLKVPTNDYTLIPTVPSYYFDQNFAPSIHLTNGVSATNNLYLTNGTVTLSGVARDATNASGLGGVMLLLSSGSYFEVAFTASNGTFSVGVTPSFWKVETEEDRLPRRGYVIPSDKPQFDTTTGAVANIHLDFPKGNAMFFGRFTNNLGVPFPNVRLDASDDFNFKARGFTDANGNYSAVVLSSTNFWYSSPDTIDNGPLANYVISQSQGATFTNGQVIRQDFTALPALSRISGQVKDNSGNPVVGVLLGANSVIGGIYYSSANVDTDNNGNYSFAVASGQWYVQFTGGGNSSENLDNQGLEDLFGPYVVNIPPTNATKDITVYPTGTPLLGQPQRFSPTQIGFNVNGAINTSYTLQASTNIASTNWVNLFSFQLTGNPFPITDSQATNRQRFYRLLKN